MNKISIVVIHSLPSQFPQFPLEILFITYVNLPGDSCWPRYLIERNLNDRIDCDRCGHSLEVHRFFRLLKLMVPFIRLVGMVCNDNKIKNKTTSTYTTTFMSKLFFFC